MEAFPEWSTIIAVLLLIDGGFGLVLADRLQPLIQKVFPSLNVRLFAAVEVMGGIYILSR
ncbi:MAG: hypothetical protein ACYTGH_10150 [Planctomycetota bacterium]|jgi:hypothetical protein